MLDQEDEGTRIGVTLTLAVVFVVIFGLIAGLVVRQASLKKAPAAVTSTTAAAALPAEFIDAPLGGDLVGSLYFALGQSALPDGAEPVVIKVALTVLDDPKRRVLVSGFHDASGSAEVNAEVARQRAVSVRSALIAEGVPAERIALRKPEVTLGDADPIEARRVEVRLVD
jgi:outer membrane protein OmpA-like peptidoglycan-associated protein